MVARRPFLRYVATYVVVLLIPIIFLVLVFRVNVLTQIRSEAEARLALEADAAIDRLANELRQIANISYQVGQSPDFISFRIADPLTAIDAQETLFVANFTNDLIEELAYFPRNAEVVYASNSPYAPETYFQRVLSIDPNSQERLEQAIRTLEQQQFLSLRARNGAPSVFFLDPVPRTGGLTKGVLVYSLSATQLASEIESIHSWQNASARLKARGELLLQTGDANGSQERAVLTHVRAIDEFGVSLEFSVSERALLEGFNRSILFLAAAVVLALLVSLPLVYVFAARHYKPVAQIERFIARTFHVTPNDRELASQVEQHVQSLLDDRALLTDQIDASSDLVIRELLMKLFRGAIQPLERLLQLCEEYGVMVKGRKFTVVMVAFSPVPPDLSISGTAELIGSRIAVDCYGFLEDDTDHLSLLICDPGDGDNDSLLNALKGVVRDPDWNHVGQFAISIGSTVERIDRISQSYVEARSALEHRHVCGMNEVFSFERIYRDQRTKYEYPVSKLARLETLVRSAHPAAIPALLEDIFAANRDQAPPLSVARMVAFDCANTLVREAAAALPENQNELWELNDALSLARLQTLSQIEEHVTTLSGHICALLDRASPSADRESFQMIVQFIEDHALEADFSANTVADFAGKSVSSFSHHFRTHAGTTFRDRVNELRMGKALELLGETNTPVGEVVQAVGYSDATSFIRKFKRDHGVTPSEFRKRAQLRHRRDA